MSLPGALSNLIGDAVSSKHIEKSHRGKYNSIINIIKILAEAIASVIVSIGLITKNHNYIYTIILIFFALDSLFTCLVSYKPKLKNNYTFKNTIKYIINTKSTFKTIYSLRAFHIIERLFLPLYIYIAIQDFQLFSTIIIVSIITQILPVVIIGIITDKNVNNSNNIVSVLKLTITSIFLIAKSKFSISLNKTVNDNLSKAYETSVQTSIQNIMIKTHGDKLFLSTIGQMSLCFSEIIVLLILSILAKFIGIQIFKFIFILSIMATIIINLNINLSEKE